mgnify:CR=1 FL=1
MGRKKEKKKEREDFFLSFDERKESGANGTLIIPILHITL